MFGWILPRSMVHFRRKYRLPLWFLHYHYHRRHHYHHHQTYKNGIQTTSPLQNSHDKVLSAKSLTTAKPPTTSSPTTKPHYHKTPVWQTHTQVCRKGEFVVVGYCRRGFVVVGLSYGFFVLVGYWRRWVLLGGLSRRGGLSRIHKHEYTTKAVSSLQHHGPSGPRASILRQGTIAVVAKLIRP